MATISFSQILLKRVVCSRMGKKGLTKSTNVNHWAKVEVVFAKVGKLESVIPPLKFLNSIENEVEPLVMIDKKVEPEPTNDERMYF